jgi:hypothetical protein
MEIIPNTSGCADPAIGADEEIIGGGIYKRDFPKTDEEIVENIYKFAEDLLWPKKAKPAGSLDEGDNSKFNKFVDGELDIGKRKEDEIHE